MKRTEEEIILMKELDVKIAAVERANAELLAVQRALDVINTNRLLKCAHTNLKPNKDEELVTCEDCGRDFL